MKSIKIIVSMIFLIHIATGSDNLFSDEQSDEVNNLRNTVQMKLDKIKKSESHDYAKNEIQIIEKYMETANNFIKDDDYEKAYYIISTAIVYFNLIDAKKEFINSEKELNEIKNKME